MRNREKDAAEKAERRERLLEAGFRLFAARSIEAVTLTEIAAEAGVGRAGLVPAALAADATSASLPVRHRPSRNSVLVRSDNRPVVLFVTVVANGRQRVFDDPAAVSCILSAWDEVRDWIVGRYVVMPDHIHFSCAPGDPSIPDFHRWMRKWKSLVARTFPVPHATPLWQRNCWDVQLRNGESYAAKWHYIVENPVRKGLVASPADWPYQGELNVLEWYDR